MSRPKKRSVSIAGHPTSVSIEPEFWDALHDIANVRGCSLASLLREIDEAREDTGLSTSVRLHVLAHYRSRSL